MHDLKKVGTYRAYSPEKDRVKGKIYKEKEFRFQLANTLCNLRSRGDFGKELARMLLEHESKKDLYKGIFNQDIVEEMVDNGMADKVFDNFDSFVGVNHDTLITKILDSRSSSNVDALFYNIDKLQINNMDKFMDLLKKNGIFYHIIYHIDSFSNKISKINDVVDDIIDNYIYSIDVSKIKDKSIEERVLKKIEQIGSLEENSKAMTFDVMIDKLKEINSIGDIISLMNRIHVVDGLDYDILYQVLKEKKVTDIFNIDTKELLEKIKFYGIDDLLTSALNDKFVDNLGVDLDYAGYKGARVISISGVIKIGDRTLIMASLCNQEYSDDISCQCCPYDGYFLVDIDTKKVVGLDHMSDS